VSLGCGPMHATCKLGWQDARRHSTYLDLQKVLGRAVQLLEGLRARIRERLHRGAGFGGELAEGIWRKRAAMDAGLGSRPANHWPDGLARTCQPLRNHGWRFGDNSLTNTRYSSAFARCATLRDNCVLATIDWSAPGTPLGA
jgi:hypothetical protein